MPQFLCTAELLRLAKQSTVFVVACSVLTSCGIGWFSSAPGPQSPAPSTTHTVMPVTTSEAGAAPTAANTAPPLDAEFAQLRKSLNAKVGVVITNVGPNPRQLALGEWTSGPAWSTMKAPLTMTALRERKLTAPTDQMRAAITASDNQAAEAIWEGLGDPVTAAHKVEAFLRTYGDPTTVQAQKVRPQFTAFGQSIWSLSDQARFVAEAVCDNGNAPILQLMGQIESDQHWGLGTVPDSRFKGGWGTLRKRKLSGATAGRIEDTERPDRCCDSDGAGVGCVQGRHCRTD